MEAIERAKRCECGEKPVLTFGTRLYRAACTRCGVGSHLSQNPDIAVERWNGGKVEALSMLPGQ